MKVIKGKTTGKGKKIGIVVARFNEYITERLLDGCLKELDRLGVSRNNITIIWVPGSYEIPVTALKMAKKSSIHAVICLGAVIRGETTHYDYIAQGAARGIAQASLTTGKPVVFGVLTTETVDQAYKRSDEKGDHKGVNAAVTALEMIDVLSRLSKK